MKKIFSINVLMVMVNILYAQNPLVKQWDYRFGGTNDELLYSLKQTPDDGYILGGWSASGVNGDKTENLRGLFDYWIVKIDFIGNKLWDKRFGGTHYDFLFTMEQTSDGGYLAGGSSYSGIGGDKTQPNWDTASSSPTPDYWIVKTDSTGNKEWDFRFGGDSIDHLNAVLQTQDGGYLLGGSTNSGISGDRTQPLWSNGNEDYWIVKTDSLGIKQWDKRFGGIYEDLLYSMEQTADGGYILGGYSRSGISGDKTEPTRGGTDYWIVKIDPLGIKQWDKRFGGSSYDYLYAIHQTNDRGYILGGFSTSDSSGDKTQDGWGGINGYDFWILKTDSLGNKQWDKDFGGTSDEDEFGDIIQTSDGGYLVSGTSYSDSSGNKTENNLGQEQSWIIKTDSLGNKLWDKTIFTLANPDDEAGFAVPTTDGCYTIANYTNSGIGGYKTQPCWDSVNFYFSDYWIIKLCDTTSTTSFEELTDKIFIKLNPNPFTSDISIAIQKESLKQAIFLIKNVLGQTVFRKEENNLSNNYTKTIDLSFLSKGIYLFDAIIDGERTVKKIIKQ